MRARALLLLLLAGTAPADDESALYFLGRARDAMAAGDLDRAAEFLEKSAKEKEGYAPTLLAIAEVAHRRGDRETAVRFLDVCLEQRQRGDLSASEREAIDAAEKLLAELDKARAEFRNLVADHIDKLMKLAASTKDKAVAAECWRTVLRIDPDHAGAREQLAGGPAPAGAAAADGAPKGIRLFNGKDLEGLTPGPEWSVADGCLRGRSGSGGVFTRAERMVKGNFAISCSMRVKEDLSDGSRFGLLFGMKSSYDNFGLWVFDDHVRVERRYEEYRSSDLQRIGLKRISEKFDRAEWHVYRVEIEGKRIRCSIDGREVMDVPGAERDLDGYVAICVGDQEAEIRWLVLEQGK